MINSPHNRLDEFIRDTMKNHETPYNEADWKEFESKLDARPRPNNIGKWNFSLNTIIVLAVSAVTTAFIYASVTHSSTPDQNTSIQNNKSVSTNNQAPSVPVKQTVEQNTSSSDEEVTTNSTPNTNSVFTSNDLSNTDNNSTGTSTEPVKTNPFAYTGGNTGLNTGNGNDPKIDPQVLQQQLSDAKKENNGGVPLYFPDMIDKRKGFVYPTKESDTIKEKAEKNNLSSPFFTTDPTGNPVLNTEALRNFLKSTKNNSGDPNSQGPKNDNSTPSDSVHANDH